MPMSHEQWKRIASRGTEARLGVFSDIVKTTDPKYLKWLEAHRANMNARDELWSDNPIKKFYERRNKDAKATNPKI